MKNCLILFTVIFCLGLESIGQTRAELEEQRNKTLDEITYVDNVLKTTEKEKTTSSNELKIIGRKLNLRENVIKGIGEEISLLLKRIELDTTAIAIMEVDLISLKKEYEKTILNSYMSKKGNPELGYILSAKDFNQGYKRLKYLQQITKFRRKQAEIIIELKNQIESGKRRLEEGLFRLSELKTKEEQQRSLLQVEQVKKTKIIGSLSNKEKQLKKELEDKKRIAKGIEIEIARIIEEEKKKAISSEMTPEQKLIGEDFAVNKGRLPWPVERGIITSQFGIHKHPILTYVTENNIGIEITSLGQIQVRSIFKGEVAKVFSIPGANMAIIIRHGKYLSVYQNIIRPKVKAGEKVETKQAIGDVFTDEKDGNNSILKFMIFETKYLDPELWIAKKM
jgi:murein hydrolase activator